MQKAMTGTSSSGMQRATRLSAALFFASGAAGLIYEVVWARQLTLFLGVTAFAHSAVVTAFLAGLAVGAVVIGRFIDRRIDPLRTYALLELAIGAWALATPWLFSLLQSLYAAATTALGWSGTPALALRFALAIAALFVPTALMGGTLPVLVRALAQRASLPRTTSWLYGLNTLGAALGCFAAGYWLLPALGVRNTVFFAATINLIVAWVAWYFLKEAPGGPGRGESATEVDGSGTVVSGTVVSGVTADLETLGRGRARLLLVGFAISGFAALVYQLAWIRVLHLVIGSSVYAFSATLTLFLTGLALGSLAWNRLAGRRRFVSVSGRFREAAVLEALVGFLAVAGLHLVPHLPGLFLRGAELGMHEDFGRFQILIFGLSALLMLPATLALGALFPLLTTLWVGDSQKLGMGVGTAYAVNTVGTILGSLVGGLILLPWLGVQSSLILAAGLHLATACAFRIAAARPPARPARAWLAGIPVGVHGPAGDDT